MALDNINKVLFITLSNIGDVILTLPVLSALKDNFPRADIDVLVGPRPREVFEKDPGINSIFVYDKHADFFKKLSLIKNLRGQRYDLAVDMRMSFIPFLIGVRYKWNLLLLPDRTKGHKRAVHLGKIKALGIDYRPQRNIFIDDRDRNVIRELLERGGVKDGDILIGVNPSSRSPLKQWRIQGFIYVIERLLRDERYRIVLIGDDTQVGISGDIEKAVKNRKLIDLTGRLNLNQLFALVERMRVLLTCDSAALHIASDLGVRIVAIFGPTDPDEYGPTGEKDIVIRKALKCSPCKKALCAFNHECMEQIAPEEVLAAVKAALG